MNSAIFITNSFFYTMLHKHPTFCLLCLHFLGITKSDGRIVKSKSRTSVRGWIHYSGRSLLCSDTCNCVDVIVMYHHEVIFVLCQGSYKLGKCSPYQTWMQGNTSSQINSDIIKYVQRHEAHPTEMNSSSSNKNPSWDMIWPTEDRKPQNWQQSTAV